MINLSLLSILLCPLLRAVPLAFGTLALLSACLPGGRLGQLSETELHRELSECRIIRNQSTSKGVACGNYGRECERRVKRDGKYRDCISRQS